MTGKESISRRVTPIACVGQGKATGLANLNQKQNAHGTAWQSLINLRSFVKTIPAGYRFSQNGEMVKPGGFSLPLSVSIFAVAAALFIYITITSETERFNCFSISGFIRVRLVALDDANVGWYLCWFLFAFGMTVNQTKLLNHGVHGVVCVVPKVMDFTFAHFQPGSISLESILG